MPITDSQKKESTLQTGAKQFIRIISDSNATDHEANVWRVDEVDEYIRQFQEAGFQLQATHYLGYREQESHPPGYAVLYVMVK